MRRTIPIVAAAWMLATGCASVEPKPTPPAAGAVEYEVTFTGTWTEASHPVEYPKGGPISGPHFSGLIGATHREGYALFAEGRAPSPGLERLSEEGKHSPLDAEIRGAIDAGLAGAIIETGPVKILSQPVSARFRVDPRHPLVSAVAMIAPSPDWFAGAADVDLREGGRFVESKEVIVYAWDSGGDDGTTYEASDVDTNPKRPTTIADSRHFVRDGKRIPVGRLTFKKLLRPWAPGE